MMQQIKGTAGALLLVAIAVVCAAILERPLAPLLSFLDKHQAPLVTICAAFMIAGFVAFMGTALYVLVWPQAPSDPASSTAPSIQYSGTRRGRRSVSREFYAETSFRSIKDAWSSGDWFADPQWRILFVMMAGALLLSIGLFGLFVVIGPLPVKLIMAGAMLYAAVRIAWAFAHA